MFRNKGIFYNEELSAPLPTPKLEDHPLSTVRDCSFDIFAATLHIRGRSSVRNPRTPHVMVTGTHLPQDNKLLYTDICTKFKPSVYKDIILSDNLHH